MFEHQFDYLEVHHDHDRGAPTELICRRHHRYVHEGGYRVITDGTGGFTFHRPDHSLIPDVHRATAGQADALQEMHGTLITARTTIPNWTGGERLDLDHAVWVYMQKARRASAEASAPTPRADPSLN